MLPTQCRRYVHRFLDQLGPLLNMAPCMKIPCHKSVAVEYSGNNHGRAGDSTLGLELAECSRAIDLRRGNCLVFLHRKTIVMRDTSADVNSNIDICSQSISLHLSI